jgi:hypothetical protein
MNKGFLRRVVVEGAFRNSSEAVVLNTRPISYREASLSILFREPDGSQIRNFGNRQRSPGRRHGSGREAWRRPCRSLSARDCRFKARGGWGRELWNQRWNQAGGSEGKSPCAAADYCRARSFPPQPVCHWKDSIVLASPGLLFRDFPNASAALIPKLCPVRINGEPTGVTLPGGRKGCSAS